MESISATHPGLMPYESAAGAAAPVSASGMPTLNVYTPPPSAHGAPSQSSAAFPLLADLQHMQFFLATAAEQFPPNPHGAASEASSPGLWQFQLPSRERISCVRWKGRLMATSTDIMRLLTFWFEAIGRPVVNSKKFEEGVFSDLRKLRTGESAILENSRSAFLDWLYCHNAVRTLKKQKVFFWEAMAWDHLFVEALNRDLKRERQGTVPSTAVGPQGSIVDPLSLIASNPMCLQHIQDVSRLGVPQPVTVIPSMFGAQQQQFGSPLCSPVSPQQMGPVPHQATPLLLPETPQMVPQQSLSAYAVTPAVDSANALDLVPYLNNVGPLLSDNKMNAAMLQIDSSAVQGTVAPINAALVSPHRRNACTPQNLEALSMDSAFPPPVAAGAAQDGNQPNTVILGSPAAASIMAGQSLWLPESPMSTHSPAPLLHPAIAGGDGSGWSQSRSATPATDVHHAPTPPPPARMGTNPGACVPGSLLSRVSGATGGIAKVPRGVVAPTSYTRGRNTPAGIDCNSLSAALIPAATLPTPPFHGSIAAHDAPPFTEQ